MTGRLQGLIVDWGGVLTPSLDAAMTAWAQADGVDFEHFREVMRAWVGPRPADGPGETACARSARRHRSPSVP